MGKNIAVYIKEERMTNNRANLDIQSYGRIDSNGDVVFTHHNYYKYKAGATFYTRPRTSTVRITRKG